MIYALAAELLDIADRLAAECAEYDDELSDDLWPLIARLRDQARDIQVRICKEM